MADVAELVYQHLVTNSLATGFFWCDVDSCRAMVYATQLRTLSHILCQPIVISSKVGQWINDYAMYIEQYPPSIVVCHAADINTKPIIDEQAMNIYRCVQTRVPNRLGTCITTSFPIHHAAEHTGQPHLHVQSAS